MRLAEKLEKLRDESGLSAREIARRLRTVSDTTVGRWLSGETEPRISEALMLATFFRVPLAFLADDTQDDPPPSAELSQDEQLALDFYRSMREHEGSASVVLKVLARMAEQGVQARPVAAQQPRGALHNPLHNRGNGGSVATSEGDSGVTELPETPAHVGPPPGQRHGTGKLRGEEEMTESSLKRTKEPRQGNKRKPKNGGG